MTDQVTARVTVRPALRAVPAARSRPGGPQVGVAIVDEMPLFREGLSVRVLRDPTLRLVGVAAHANPAVLLRDRLAVDVLVLDAVLDPRALLIRRLMAANPQLTVVVLVREPHRTSHYLAAARAAGARGLVPHSAAPERILDAIRRSRSTGEYVDPALSGLIVADRVSAAPAGRPLSRREDEVLRLIADGYSNQGIADALVVSVETVRTHIKSLLRKLSARDRAHAVSLGYRTGLLTAAPDVAIPQARDASFGSQIAMN
ncbi:MAG TPA: response regulator transcription factor [Pseudonocardiaceae bacterium]|jgi:DNA-binding NarL/FixJ family response regulator|nr:response regulator transcription factor [Pseudonocardiaceae bacterium]